MVNLILLITKRRRQCNKANCAALSISIIIIVYAVNYFLDSRGNEVNVIDSPFDQPLDNDFVGMTLLTSAKYKEACTDPNLFLGFVISSALFTFIIYAFKSCFVVCLDGSLPGYLLRRGFGSGSESWILHVEGGGWCYSVESCTLRKFTHLGSSKHMDKKVPFQGLLSSSPSENPDFYNWNKVMIRYCDGGSFASISNSTVQNGQQIYFRGKLIWEALVDELLSLGMSSSKQTLLTGCSAGGLATLIHCESFRKRLPKDANVKCLVDAGFFIDEKDILGKFTLRSFYREVVALQGLANSFPTNCVSHMDSYKCMFPREIIKSISVPLFFVQPAYDFWQIQNILAPKAADRNGDWQECRLNLNSCNTDQIKALLGYRDSLLTELSDFMKREDGGFFINSCFIHCQTWMSTTWHSPNSPRINNKTIAETVANWYFNRGPAKQIDCPDFNCNPSCHNTDFILSKYTVPRQRKKQNGIS